MKTKALLIVFCALVSLFISQEISAQNKKNEKETVKFYVEEMECKNCQARVEKNIAFEKGVSDIKCDLPSKTVEVTYNASKTNPEKLISGFKKIKMNAVIITNVQRDKKISKK